MQTNKRLWLGCLLSGALFSALFPSVVSGELLWYEGFVGQTVGTAISADANWVYGGSAADIPLVSSGSLSYGALQESAGNSIMTTPNAVLNASSFVKREYANQTGALYASFLINVQDLHGMSSDHKEQVVSLHTSGYNGVALRRNATNTDRFDILLSPNDASTDFTADDNGGLGYETNQTFLIVFGTEDADSASAFKLWINPTELSGTAPAADVTETLIVRTATAQIFYIYANHWGVVGSNSPIVQLDEIRVGTSYAEVTPTSPGYSLLAAPNNPLWGSVDPTSGFYDAGTNVTLMATASNHYYFSNWSGSISGINPVTNVVMDADKNITANFAPDPYLLTVVSAHGSPVPAGTTTNAYGAILTNTVDSMVMNGLTQYVCTGWTMTGNAPASGSTNVCVMTLVNTPATLTWNWQTNVVSNPVMDITPQSLSFAYTLAEDMPASQSFTVTNAGAGTLSVSNDWNAGWLTVDPVQASGLGNGQGATFTVTVSTNNLTAGTSNGVITVYGTGADNSPQEIAVQLSISEPVSTEWPTFGSDNNRDFYMGVALAQPLAKAWVRTLQEPTPEYTAIPNLGLQQRTKFHPVQYDRAPSSIVVSNRLYTSASTEEAVFCSDAATGTNIWTFHAEGAVRLAPTYANEKIYFGADDGFAYCLNASDGSLVWQVAAATNTPRRAVFNQHIGSSWPVRTGVTVDGGDAFFGGGYLSPQGSYLCSVDAETGALNWRQTVEYNFAGYILATSDKLYAGTGRTAPVEYDRATGAPTYPTIDSGRRREGGGIHLSMLDNGMLTYGPSENGVSCVRVTTNYTATYFSTETHHRIPGSMAYINSTRILKDADRFYFLHVTEAPQHSVFPQSIFSVAVSDATNAFWNSVNDFDSRTPRAWSDVKAIDVFWNYGSDKYAICSEPTLINDLDADAAWEVAAGPVLSGLLTPNALYAGGTNLLVAYNPTNGAVLWSSAVTGSVYELSMDGAALYVGTDAGYIYCFSNNASGSIDESAPVYTSPYLTNDADYAKVVEAATLAITNADTTKGYCVVLGAGDGRLAYEIAQRSDFIVLGLETDSTKASAAREKLMQAGVYGSRVVIHEDMDELFPHPDYFANLIVSEELLMNGSMPYSSQEIFRMLQPYGGTVLFGNKDGNLDLTSWVGDDMTAWSDVASAQGITWKIARRGEPAGFGRWNYQYGSDAGNTLCSEDQLVKDEFDIQWVREISPDKAADRHYIAASPLVADGIMVNIGLNYINAVDSYNGTTLWDRDMEHVIRMVAPMDAPMMYMENDKLYLSSSNTCYVFDVNNGNVLNTFPSPAANDDWGYVGVISNILFGSCQKPTASLGIGMDIKLLYEAGAIGSWPIVSHTFFAKDSDTGSTIWTYTNAAVLNSSITFGGSHVFLAVSSNSTAIAEANNDGRIALTDFLASGAALIALDMETGAKVWEQPLGLFAGSQREEMLMLSYAADRLLMVETYWNDPGGVTDAHYLMKVLDAADGTQVGSEALLTGGLGGQNETDHNGVLLRPNLVGGKAYMRTYKSNKILEIDLADGSTNLLTIATSQGYKGCSALSASASHFYHRGYAIEAIDIATQTGTDITTATRPGCWPTVIPSGGILTMYDGSAGCNCGMAIQSSMALAPVVNDTNAPDLFNVVALDDTTVVVVFDEAVNPATAEDEGNYSLDNGITVSSAVRQANHLERVTLTVSTMAAGTNIVTVNGVKDLHNNAMTSQQMEFESGAADTDIDGLPDSWEQQIVDADLDDAIAAISDVLPDDDFDGDGLTNWQEYIAGTDPTDPFSSLLVGNIVDAPGSGYAISWDSQEGRTYNVLWTESMDSAFTNLATGIAYPQSSWTDTLHGAASEGFYQIQVVK